MKTQELEKVTLTQELHGLAIGLCKSGRSRQYVASVLVQKGMMREQAIRLAAEIDARYSPFIHDTVFSSGKEPRDPAVRGDILWGVILMGAGLFLIFVFPLVTPLGWVPGWAALVLGLLRTHRGLTGLRHKRKRDALPTFSICFSEKKLGV